MVEGTWDVLLDRVNSHCLDAAFVVSSEFEKRGGMGYYDLFREGALRRASRLASFGCQGVGDGGRAGRRYDYYR